MLNNDKNINEVLENISKSKPYGICNLCCQRVSYGYQFLFDNGINCKMYCACTEKYHNFEIDDFSLTSNGSTITFWFSSIITLQQVKSPFCSIFA